MSKPTTRYKVLVSDSIEPYQFYIHATGRKDAVKQVVEDLDLYYPYLTIVPDTKRRIDILLVKTKKYKVVVRDFASNYDFYIFATGRKDAAKQIVEKLELNHPHLYINIESSNRKHIYIFGTSTEGVVELSATGFREEESDNE